MNAAYELNLTPHRLSDLPSDIESRLISASRSVTVESECWPLGKLFKRGLVEVQTSHAIRSDGNSWHSRVSRHPLPFDQFWALLGNEWIETKKAFNDLYIHEIKQVTLVKTLSRTASIWRLDYGFSAPISPRVFTVLQVTHLDDSAGPPAGWVVHVPIDIDDLCTTPPGTITGRYACVERIVGLPGGETEWRLVTCSAPGGLIPRWLAERSLPARIALDVTSFIDWYYTSHLQARDVKQPPSSERPVLGVALALVNVLTLYQRGIVTALLMGVVASHGDLIPWLLLITVLSGSVMLYHWNKPSLDRDWVPWTDRLLIGMRDPMIPAVLELGGNLSLDRARELVCSRLIASVPRMSDRLVVPTSGAPYWERCGRMDVTMHVREHKVDGAGYAQLRSVIEALGRAPVDFSRPPWDVSVIHLGDLETVVFVRVHHAITDGRGVSDLLMACADQSRPPRERIAPHSRASTLASLLDLQHLSRPPERTSAIKRREPLSEAAVAWTRRPFRIDDLKASTGRLGGGTINDILLAAVSGALQKYLSAGSHHISCKLPVDVFSPTDLSPEVVLGVHLSDLNVPLPVDEPDAFARFARVRETMRQAKSGYRTGLTAMASRLVGGLPARMRLGMIAADAQTVSCYVSNMRGPAMPLSIGGVPVDTVRCHPLGLNNIGVGIAVYSYNGALNVAVCTDRALIPDPDSLCEHLEDQLEQLAKLDVTGVQFLGQSPMFCASHSIDLPFSIQAVAPILLPADAGAISRFLVGTRDPSLKVGTDFIHHGADWVTSFDLSVIGSLPLISQLEAGTELQRDCFTVVDKVPVAFGLVQQTVTVKSWQILDPEHHRSAYEIVVQGAGVRVWKSRQLEDLGPGKTRVVERIWGVCPWILKSVVAKDSVTSLRKSMERYSDMVTKYNP